MTKMRCISNKIFYTEQGKDREFDLPVTVGKEYFIDIVDSQFVLYSDNKKFEPILVPMRSDISKVDLLNCFCPV